MEKINDLKNVSDMVNDSISKSKNMKVAVLKAEWETVVGKFSTKIQPKYIQDRVLKIIVEDPLYASHLKLKEREFVEKINCFFGEDVIETITTEIGKLQEIIDESFSKKKIISTPEVEKMGVDIKIPKGELLNQEKEIENDEKSELNSLNIQEKISHLHKMAIERERFLLSNGYKKCKKCGMIYEGEEEYCRVCIESGKAGIVDGYGD